MLLVYGHETRGRVAPEGGVSINRNIPIRHVLIDFCSPEAVHFKGADELLICAMPAARNVNIIHLLFALQPML